MTRAADTSLVVASLFADHPAYVPASEAMQTCTATIAHVVAEAYSVMTRLPASHRVDASNAALLLQARLASKHVGLSAEIHARAPTRLASAGVSGGATYDGLIALTALEHDLELLSLDRRAARTYSARGARFQLIG